MKECYVDSVGHTTISLMEIELGWLVTSVESRVRGQGHASRLMEQLTTDADAESVTLLLSVQPDGTGRNGEQLHQYYRRFGFIEHPHLGDPDALVRYPRQGKR